MAFQFNEEFELLASDKSRGGVVSFEPHETDLQAQFAAYWIEREKYRRTLSRTLYRTEMDNHAKGEFIRRFGQVHYEQLPLKKAA